MLAQFFPTKFAATFLILVKFSHWALSHICSLYNNYLRVFDDRGGSFCMISMFKNSILCNRGVIVTFVQVNRKTQASHTTLQHGPITPN